MAYTPQPFRSFAGGLNLRDQPADVDPSQAIDLLNVTFTELGAVQQRDGYAEFSTGLTNQPDSVFPHYETDGTKQLLVGNGARTDALNTSGTSVANQAFAAFSFTRFGGPAAEYTYIANGTDQVRRWDGSAFSAPGGLSAQTGKFLTVTPTSNRLVIARETGTTAGNNPSSVTFSDAGAPETITAANFIDLDPGDGEAIMGLAVYGDQVFIFKETKFWVHYGESVSSTGTPVFNVRKVNTGVGLAASKAIAVGRDGVYFMGRDGVYRTGGGAPELLSDVIEPFFTGGTSAYYQSSTLNHGSLSLAAATWHDDRFYLAVPTGSTATNDRMLVYDPKHRWWSLWDMAAAAMCRFRIGNQEEFVFAGPTGDNDVYRHSSAYLNDNMASGGTGGSAITSRWRSGWIDYGTPDVKKIRESHLAGTGTVTIAVAKDWEGAAAQGAVLTLSSSTDLWADGTGTDLWGDGTGTDTWGPSNTIRAKMARQAIRGKVFSTLFSNAALSTTWAVHRLEHHLLDRRVASVVGTERTL